jgi:glycosyltransferase involved in cell wall biosynthesis
VVHKMHRAGTETLLMQIYRNIDRDKVQFDFLVHTDQPGHYDDEIRNLGGKIVYIPVSPRKNYLLYTKTLKNIILQNGPYICVHSHMSLLSGVILKVAYSANIPLRIAHSHTDLDSKGNSFSRRVYGWYMRHQIRHYATHVLAVSRPAGEWLFGKNCWQDPRVQILHNATDLKPYEMLCQDRLKLRKELGLPINGILLGHVGRFEPEKNHQKLLEIFSHLVKLKPTAHLILVGEGSLEDEVRSLIKSLGLQENVYMLGVRSDIPELMGALNLFLFPSLFEGLGIVLIEAQAAGVPCIVSDTTPSEADLGLGLLKFVPLSADCDIWVRSALDALDSSRLPWSTREKALKQNNYDISKLALELQELYSHELN